MCFSSVKDFNDNSQYFLPPLSYHKPSFTRFLHIIITRNLEAHGELAQGLVGVQKVQSGVCCWVCGVSAVPRPDPIGAPKWPAR